MDMDAIIEARRKSGANPVGRWPQRGEQLSRPRPVSGICKGSYIWQALKARGITVDPETLAFENKTPPDHTSTGEKNAVSRTNLTPQQILLVISGGIAAHNRLN